MPERQHTGIDSDLEKLKERLRSYLPKELPPRSNLERYRPQEAWFLNKQQAYGTQHDIGHLTRVLVMQEIIANSLQESDTQLDLDREALRWAASTHDVRKQGEYELNFQIHGMRASRWVEEEFVQKYSTIPPPTVGMVSYLNYFHGFRDSKIPKPHPAELDVLRDADGGDIIRVTHTRLPLVGTPPPFVRDMAFGYLQRGMHYDVSRRLLPFTEQLGILSRRKDSYMTNPFAAVMDSAEELGLVTSQ